MKNLKALAPVLALALFPACAKKKSEAQPVVVPPPSLAGEYTAQDPKAINGMDPTCIVGARNQGQNIGLTFDAADNFVQTTVSFNDGACRDAAFQQIVTGHFKLGAQTATAGIYQLDTAALKVELTPYTDRLADEWRRIRFCNIADWAKGATTPVPNPASCGLGVDLTVGQFSVVNIVDANNIKLGRPNTANRDEDGKSPEHRFSLVDDSIVYLKKGAQQPGNNGPTFDGVCPLMAGHQYACDARGEEPFSGRDLSVTANNIPGGAEIILDLSKPGETMITQKYQANGQVNSTVGGSFRTDESAGCSHGELITKTVITRQGDAWSKTAERHMRVAGNNDLLIDTATTEKQDPNHAGQTTGVRTQCRMIR